jgi:hypothetical protein
MEFPALFAKRKIEVAKRKIEVTEPRRLTESPH